MNMSPIIFLLISLTVSFQGQSSAGYVQSPLEKCLDLCQSHSCQNDRNVREGCNQMFSCAHGCKLRQLGVEKGVCRDRCDRNGQLGCSPNVSGWEFDLCRECNCRGCTKWPQVGECEQGCNFYGKSPLEECLDLCQSNSCQNGRNVREGCNQMFSCAHGCKLRQLGVVKGVCRDLCDRNGQSGCSPNVSGWRFDLCRECNRGGCTKWPQVGECEQGCDFYKGGGGSGSLGRRWCRIGEHELKEQNPSPILRCGGGSSGLFNTGFSESIIVSAKGTAVNFLSGIWNYHSHYGGRPAYKKENGGYYLFWQENRWVVEPKLGRHTHESGGYPLFGYIRAEVDELYPENVGNRWMEVYSRQVDPNIYVTGY